MTFASEKKLLFFEQAMEHVSVGIHAIDKNGNNIIYNKKMREMIGLDESSEHLSIIDLFHQQKQLRSLKHVLESGKPMLNVKQTYWNKEGHEITSLNDTYPIFDNGELLGAIEFARDITSLEKLIYMPLRRYGQPLTFDIITAVSDEMKSVIEFAKKATFAEKPVLLIGESGTGKDMIAEGIHHYLSPKKDQFITIFSRREDERMLTTIENALKQDKPCTIFFERIEFLQLDVQSEILNLIEQYKSKNHMLIASCGSDPIELIANKQLLKELYYYFAAQSITVPPLRERKVDIKPFVDDYLERHRKRYQSHITDIDDNVIKLWMSYDWPGNLKELELLLDEITASITNEKSITHDMLPVHFLLKAELHAMQEQSVFIPRTKNDLLPLDQYLKEAEQFYLNSVLNMFNGNITHAANALKISRQNLQYRIRKMKKGEPEK